MAATTFESSGTVNGSLSGGSLVYTSTGAGSSYTTRPLTGLSYAEFTITTLTGTPACGVVGRNWTGNQLGTDATSVGYLSSGLVKYNGATLATLTALAAGDRVGVAVDFANRLIWFRVNNGNWNGSALNNPATGVGGLSFAITTSIVAFISTALFGVSASLTGTVWTAKFSTPFTDTAPTGFITADTQQITLAQSPLVEQILPAVALSVTTLARTALDSRAYKMIFPAGTITVVSGTTKEGGVAVAGKRVDVYDRLTGELLGTTTSDGSGNWSIPALGRPAVRVVGSDPTTFNSLVFDNVVPV